MRHLTSSKDISVNLWDDYKQEPEYPVTDPTTLTLESTESLTGTEIFELREILVNRCKDWKEATPGAPQVEFIRDPRDSRVIHILHLTAPLRHSLYSYLSSTPSTFFGLTLRWLMES